MPPLLQALLIHLGLSNTHTNEDKFPEKNMTNTSRDTNKSNKMNIQLSCCSAHFDYQANPQAQTNMQQFSVATSIISAPGLGPSPWRNNFEVDVSWHVLKIANVQLKSTYHGIEYLRMWHCFYHEGLQNSRSFWGPCISQHAHPNTSHRIHLRDVIGGCKALVATHQPQNNKSPLR